MLKNIYTNTLLIISAFLLVISCDKGEPVVVHEHEVFTRVVLEVKKDGETNFKKYTFEVEGHDDHGHDDHGDDDHGDDDHGDEHTEVELDTNSTYHVGIFFYNDSDPDNIEDVTLEVIEEADAHQVFYEMTEISGFSIAAASDDTKDSNGNPLFLKTSWTTASETSGDVMAYLIHEPSSKTGSARADFGGATDVEIEFEVHIE
jgi:hypothetical protein|tara:strand:+ start:233 stop:841 length:609 start_codon:yes stop_codon:yes gene_type:complete